MADIMYVAVENLNSIFGTPSRAQSVGLGKSGSVRFKPIFSGRQTGLQVQFKKFLNFGLNPAFTELKFGSGSDRVRTRSNPSNPKL